MRALIATLAAIVVAAPACSNGDHRGDTYAAQTAAVGESLASLGWHSVTRLAVQPLSAPTPERLTGTVCLGPQRDQSQVRGIYAYSPSDRIAGTQAALWKRG